jgi:hypothetical protein
LDLSLERHAKDMANAKTHGDKAYYTHGYLDRMKASLNALEDRADKAAFKKYAAEYNRLVGIEQTEYARAVVRKEPYTGLIPRPSAKNYKL